jgi:hypothetical protein
LVSKLPCYQHTKVGVTPDHPRLAAALEYAAFGWTSFPVPVGAKKSHKKGERDANKTMIGPRWGATNDPDKIRADFRALQRRWD